MIIFLTALLCLFIALAAFFAGILFYQTAMQNALLERQKGLISFALNQTFAFVVRTKNFLTKEKDNGKNI